MAASHDVIVDRRARPDPESALHPVKVVRLSLEAVDELVQAAGWYQARRPGLGSEFHADVDRVLPLIARSPKAFPRLLDLPADLTAECQA
jgi:hypothetical protein